MREFQERRFWRRIIFSRPTFAFLIIILTFSIYSTVKIYLRFRKASSINKNIENQIAEVKTKKADLEANINRLQTEEGLEAMLREKFPIQKPGEKTVIIIEEEIKPSNSSATNSLSFFKRIWQFVRSIF